MERCVSTNDKKEKVRKIQHIHDDIAFSILSKLSIKSLKRFGCVCKPWSLLFDNPNFMNLYRKSFLTKDHSIYDHTSFLLHKKNHAPFEGYYHDETFELYSLSRERFENMVQLDWPKVTIDRPFPLPDYDSGFDILGSGSVNGILCLFCAFKVNIVLWNPYIKEFKVIPPSPSDSGPYWEVCVDHQGFGYDHVRNDYKGLRSLGFLQMTDCDLDVLPYKNITFDSSIWEVYSLRSNSWRKLDFDMNYEPVSSLDEQLYMDGLSHWLCKRETNNEECLLSFDWCNEVFVTTFIPSDMIWSHLVLLNGSIALILNYTETTTFHISILDELGVEESWTKIFIVGPLPYLEYPIGVGKKGDILFRKKDGEHAWFDLNTQMIENLGIITERFCCKLVIHKENLLPFEGESI